MNRKRCANCGYELNSPKHILNQRYCAKEACQKARKRKWKAENPYYWIRYRQNKIKPHELKNRRIKILLEKSALANLTKNGEISCICQIVLKS